MLTHRDLQDLAAIFDEVIDLDEASRRIRLAERCAGRPALRAEVDALLAAAQRSEAFLVAPARRDDDEPQGDAREGSQVGAWRLLRRIGSGGMGDVYLAERADGAFTARAAVKFTRTHLIGPDASRRFVAERQFLASLNHPNIVTLLDGGTAPAGEGYLVMEYVEGLPISEYCRRQALSLEARLELMRQVCAAVQYAHQRSIVHRDLKPGNILVTADGVPKVLDFGIAKLLEGTAGEGTMTAGALLAPLTPNYTSPEQLRGLTVTTASDVYSLGVILYEVVTQQRPYDTTGRPLDAVVKIVTETEPQRPSGGGEDPTLPYARRRLRGDLDAVVLKAMRKEPEARYGSAGELADDLGRILSGQPVVAREPSIGYTMRRLAGRHKAAAAVALAALVAVLVALGAALWQRQIAIEERARAEERFREVRQLSNALIFRIHDSVAKLPGSTPVRREIVDEALKYLEGLGRESAHDPELRLELANAYRQIGGILGDPQRPNLGDRPGAIRELRRSRALLLPLAGAADAPMPTLTAFVDTTRTLAGALKQAGSLEEAEAAASESVHYAERAVARGLDDARSLLARALFASALVAHPSDAAIPRWKRVEALYAGLLAEQPDDPTRQRNLALVDKYLGSLLDAGGRDDEAAVHYARALELDERRLAADPANRTVMFDAAISLANMSIVEEGRGDLDRAYDLTRRSVELRAALADSDPADVLARGRVGVARTRLALLERKRGRLTAARDLAEQAVRDQQTLAGTTRDAVTRVELGKALVTLGGIELDLGRTREGCGAVARGLPLLDGEKDVLREATFSTSARAAIERRCR